MIDDETVRNVARLARIGLEAEEVRSLSNQLSRILLWFRTLDEIDPGEGETLFPGSCEAAPLRKDVARPSCPRDAMLGNTDHGARGVYRVPRVIE